jgi:hypothetical protein
LFALTVDHLEFPFGGKNVFAKVWDAFRGVFCTFLSQRFSEINLTLSQSWCKTLYLTEQDYLTVAFGYKQRTMEWAE